MADFIKEKNPTVLGLFWAIYWRLCIICLMAYIAIMIIELIVALIGLII